MIADYLHSFYRMPVNLVIGGVPTVATIRWFKAPAGAQRLPFPSAIFSHVWDNNPGESVVGEVGEVGTPRTWDQGNNVGYQGQCYRGDPSWFATGNLPPLGSIAPAPCLCVIPPAVGSGTLLLSGAASAAKATLGCNQCPGGAPLNWTLTISGGTGDFAQFNGTFVLAHQSGCAWNFAPPPRVWSLSFLFQTWQVRLNNTVTHVSVTYTVSGSFACLAPNPSWSLQGQTGTGTPGAASVAPGP